MPTKLSTAAEVRAAMLTKLAASNLTKEDVRTLRLVPYTTSECAAALNGGLPAHAAGFKIPYFDLKGKPTQFYRYRYLEDTCSGFAALAEHSALRYAQPRDSVNELYLPPFLPWDKMAQDPSKNVLITEGELKAACACKASFPTLGLGGVWCFKSTKQNLPLLEAFSWFKWEGRIVYICFDSDITTNAEVARAAAALARKLLALGARPFICRLPALELSKKTGLDDFLVARSAEALKEVLELAEEYAASAALYQLNEEVQYVRDPGLVFRLANYQRMAASSFVQHAYANRTYEERTTTAKGTKTVVRSAAAEWLKWPHRATVERITYLPGQPRFTAAEEYNLWAGFATEPHKGDLTLYRQLFKHLFAELTPEEQHFVECWMAHPIKFPGTKLFTALVLWSQRQGTGKSTLGYMLGAIYGMVLRGRPHPSVINAEEISEEQLFAAFNAWAENKQFVMADEIASSERKSVVLNWLKSIITRQQLRINPKYVPDYTVPDCINYLFTSNHDDSFLLEDEDRRFCVVHVPEEEHLNSAFWQKFYKWLYEEGGAAAIHHHFVNDVDFEGFRPEKRAPMTAAKRAMIEDNRSDLYAWLYRVKDNPAEAFPSERLPNKEGYAPPRRCATPEQFAMAYDPTGQRGVTADKMGRALARAKFTKLNRGNGTVGGLLINGVLVKRTLWAVRDVEQLSKMTEKQLAAEYNSYAARLSPKTQEEE